MSRLPEESPSTSTEFKERLMEMISEEDCENGNKCTNREFAARVGVNKSVISNATSYGIVPSVKSLIKIADYENCSLEYLLGTTDDKTFYPAKDKSSFADRLMALKDEGGFSFTQITDAARCSRNYIHVWIKRGNLPSLPYLREIAKFFKVSSDYLLGRTDYKN